MRLSKAAALLALALAACGEAPPPGGATPPAIVPGSVEVRGADRDVTGQALWAVDFGTVEPGTLATRPIVLANPGDEPLTVHVEGVAAPFGGMQGELQLGAGAEQPITLEFAPLAYGDASATAVLRWGTRSVSILLAGRTPAPPCSITVDPPQIDFGTVRDGQLVGAELRIGLSEGCGQLEGFSLGDGAPVEAEPVVLEDGALGVAISWLPAAEGPMAAELAVVATGGVQIVPIRGEAVPWCGELSAPLLDFGVQVPGCARVEQSFSLRNRCSHPIPPPLVSWRSPLDEDFSVDAAGSSMPESLAPGEEASFVASYTPDETVGSDVGLIRFWEGRNRGADLELVGEASWAGNARTDSHFQPGAPQVLMVVDGSIFAEPFASRLDAYVSDLVEFLGPYEATLGVTSTTLSGTSSCPGEDGRLVPVDGSRPRLVRLDAPDAAQQVRAHLADVERCAESSEGAAIEAAARALTPPLIDSADDPRHAEAGDGNLGLLTEGHIFWWLFFSARDDLSGPALDSYGERFALMPEAHDVVLQPFAPGPVGCDGAPASPRFVDAFGMGLQPVCSDDWRVPLVAGWNGGSSVPRATFWLVDEPRDLDLDGRITEASGEIEVWLGDQRLPSQDGETAIWAYDQGRSSVVFARPPPGPATIDIRYTAERCLE